MRCVFVYSYNNNIMYVFPLDMYVLTSICNKKRRRMKTGYASFILLFVPKLLGNMRMCVFVSTLLHTCSKADSLVLCIKMRIEIYQYLWWIIQWEMPLFNEHLCRRRGMFFFVIESTKSILSSTIIRPGSLCAVIVWQNIYPSNASLTKNTFDFDTNNKRQ